MFEKRFVFKHANEFIATGGPGKSTGGFAVLNAGTRKGVISQTGKLQPSAFPLEQYVISKPSASAAFVVNAEDISGGAVAAATIARGNLDYPRNLLYTLVDAASNTLEAVFVATGTDQFGATVSETVTVDYSVAATTAGTQIFATVTSVSITPTNQAASDTASVGVAVAADVASFGLPKKLGAVTDVKSVNWIDAGTSKNQNIDSTSVVVARSCFRPEQTVDAADDYVIHYFPTGVVS